MHICDMDMELHFLCITYSKALASLHGLMPVRHTCESALRRYAAAKVCAGVSKNGRDSGVDGLECRSERFV